MDGETLKKVQNVLLEIALEVQRVCDENDIACSLTYGSLLGAVRHQGFIPWDDDLDLAMPREDYDRFREIAAEKLDPRFCFQDWHTDPNYSNPFGKVRLKNTKYIGAKDPDLSENGFYVDIFPLNYMPKTEKERKKQIRLQSTLCRIKLMKSHYKPWQEDHSINLKKRIGYLPFQLASLFFSQQDLIRRHDAISLLPPNDRVYEEAGVVYEEYPADCFRNLREFPFAGATLKGPVDYDQVLTTMYGDYMQLPPVEERENRHQIQILEFPRD